MSSFLKLVYDSVTEYEQSASSLKIDSHSIEPYTPSLFATVDSHFISSNVMADINKRMRYVYTIKYKFEGRNVKLVIVLSKRDSNKIRFIFTIVNLIQYILNRIIKSDKDINLYMIDSKMKKVKPKDGSSLTSDNVNTGVTFFYYFADHRDVYIFRNEEMIKVLIHELVHFYDLDKKSIQPDLESSLNQMFNLQGKSINVNESFTDTYACILNILVYCALKARIYQKNIKWYASECNRTFKREHKHILSQSVNVLKYNGYTIKEDRIVPTREISETTSVTSYYVLKAIMFSNIKVFLKYLDEHHYKLENEFKYIELIKNNVILYIDQIRHLFVSSTKDSLRMTIIDISNFEKEKVYKENSIGYSIKKWPLKKHLLPHPKK